MKFAITSKKAYHETMIKVFDLMNKGESNLTKNELKALAAMANAAEDYEDNVLRLKPVRQPETIAELVELKMYQDKITQAKLAETLGLAKSKLSEILSGRRKPDISFIKALYKKLHIDAAFLLDHV